ncbi:hypothetical protein AB205_0190320 [Aquarana catesbeiana]|uniref:Uncharacterized protein n=1 Tax=Aquarana catesbeiana TaxID=8400 RepID=A0A2G9S7T7_AQUCT|nr:hypothetical protein AB205_0190320 [Aquarana catesbeiana]
MFRDVIVVEEETHFNSAQVLISEIMMWNLDLEKVNTPNKLFQTKHYSPSQPLPLSENISAAGERPGLALLPGVLSAAGEKTGCLGSLRHAVGDLGRLPSIPGLSPAVFGPVASPSAGNPTPSAPANCWGGRLTALPPWNSVVDAGAGQRLVALCPVASTSAGDSASSTPANRWGRRLASSIPKLCSCHWGGEPAASFSILSSGCWDDMSVVLSPRCTDLCWGGKTTSSTLANCWGGTMNTSSPFSPCILICCWEVTTFFSP